MTDVLTRRITLRVAIGLSALTLTGACSESHSPTDPTIETSTSQSSRETESRREAENRHENENRHEDENRHGGDDGAGHH